MAKNDQAADTTEEFDPEATPQGMATEDADGFSFNMADEKASSGYPLIPVGTHEATVEDCQYQISKNSGNPMWAVKYAVPVTEQNKDGEDVVKIRKVTSYVVFSAEQRGRAKQFVKRVAPDLAELTDFNPKLLASQIVGRNVRVKINHQPGQDDEVRSNVADVLAPTGGAAGGSFASL